MRPTSNEALGVGQNGLGRIVSMAIGSVALVALLGAFLVWRSNNISHAKSLFVYCAASMRKPVEEAAAAYEEEFGVRIELTYGGSNALLSQLEISKTGDLYLAADNSYLALAKEKGLTAEQMEVAHIRPVIIVKKGNPKHIVSLQDLLRDDVRVILGDPDHAAIGKKVKQLLSDAHVWQQLEKHVVKRGAFMPTVTEATTAVLAGANADASIVWDATASQYSTLDTIRVPELDRGVSHITIGIATSSKTPTEAIRFARYLTARDRGLPLIKKHGFRVIAGDSWAELPTMTIFSGGVNRLAIDDSITTFAKREGVEINRIYLGCGILVSQMQGIRSGARNELFPDMYVSCDASYHQQVSKLFQPPIVATSMKMVILVQPGNPHNVQTPFDLGKQSMRIGLANPDESALGGLSRTLLKEEGCYTEVMKNCVVQTPTADMLVNAMKAGGLDAVIVYEVNCVNVKDDMPILSIDSPKSKATQTYAVAQSSKYPRLTNRLMKYLLRAERHQRFKELGFQIK